MKHLLTAALLMGTLMAADRTVTTLNFSTDHGLMIVHVNIDNQPKLLVFDTGAERTMLQDNRRLEHSAYITLGDGNNTDQFSRIHIFLIPLPSLGGMSVDGMLGQDILRQYSSVSINYATHTITLER